eukprot:scaffold37142_cov21-Tisochrysis_lutea.AAC.1
MQTSAPRQWPQLLWLPAHCGLSTGCVWCGTRTGRYRWKDVLGMAMALDTGRQVCKKRHASALWGGHPAAVAACVLQPKHRLRAAPHVHQRQYLWHGCGIAHRQQDTVQQALQAWLLRRVQAGGHIHNGHHRLRLVPQQCMIGQQNLHGVWSRVGGIHIECAEGGRQTHRVGLRATGKRTLCVVEGGRQAHAVCGGGWQTLRGRHAHQGAPGSSSSSSSSSAEAAASPAETDTQADKKASGAEHRLPVVLHICVLEGF